MLSHQPVAIKKSVARSDVVNELADRVEAGNTVDADLTDGTFSELMEELRKRGFVLTPRAKSDPVKWLNPFSFRVMKQSEEASHHGAARTREVQTSAVSGSEETTAKQSTRK